ncbi:MAG: VWA domain-containing protein [Candidatus Tectomicrobia bacterium]|nr:VWA domain-containing protein [Candidatus Tectomicrobia bacterium]
MSALESIQWKHPELLWGLTALPILGYLIRHHWRRLHRMHLDWSLAPEVRAHAALPSRRTAGWHAAFLLSSWTLAILGFASPTLPGATGSPVWERASIGLLLDVSRSMQAAAEPHDLAGSNRLELAQQAVREFITSLPSGVRIGVIAFAGVAVPIVATPSADHQAVLAKVWRLHTQFIRHPGTALADAIRQGHNLFAEMPTDQTAGAIILILLSDGDTHLTPDLREAIQQASLPIHTLGIGSPAPARLSTSSLTAHPGGSRRQTPLVTTVNPALLRWIAEQTGGRYAPFVDRDELNRTLRQIVSQQRHQVLERLDHARSLHRVFFLGAFGCLLIYQILNRPRIGDMRPSDALHHVWPSARTQVGSQQR